MSLTRFRRRIVLVAAEDAVAGAARKLRDEHVGCVIIVRDGRPQGILTDRDITLRLVAEGRDGDKTLVSEIMTHAPIVLREDDEIATATARMREHGIRRLPIVDDEGKVVGIVTADELMVLFGREIADLGGVMDDSSDATDSR